MSNRHLLLTGFGPFLDVGTNPSGELASALNGREVGGLKVSSIELPVYFDGVAPTYAKALEELAPDVPVALLSMGLHRGAYFRLEERARPNLDSIKPDSKGKFAEQLTPLGARELKTSFDLEKLSVALREGGAGEVRISDNAGGYVCERTYYEVLTQAERLGVPGLFLHVPPIECVSVADQLGPVQSLIAEMNQQALG